MLTHIYLLTSGSAGPCYPISTLAHLHGEPICCPFFLNLPAGVGSLYCYAHPSTYTSLPVFPDSLASTAFQSHNQQPLQHRTHLNISPAGINLIIRLCFIRLITDWVLKGTERERAQGEERADEQVNRCSYGRGIEKPNVLLKTDQNKIAEQKITAADTEQTSVTQEELK